MSPISSRNSVPPSACSKRPRRCCCAPVNEPRSWPNSSDSSRSFGLAAVLIATNGRDARALCRCKARATSSFPVPDSPVISTVALDCESRPMARNTSCMARSEEHTSELQSHSDLVCRLLLEKKKQQTKEYKDNNELTKCIT